MDDTSLLLVVPSGVGDCSVTARPHSCFPANKQEGSTAEAGAARENHTVWRAPELQCRLRLGQAPLRQMHALTVHRFTPSQKGRQQHGQGISTEMAQCRCGDADRKNHIHRHCILELCCDRTSRAESLHTAGLVNARHVIRRRKFCSHK